MSVISITRAVRRRLGVALLVIGLAGAAAGLVGHATWEPTPDAEPEPAASAAKVVDDDDPAPQSTEPPTTTPTSAPTSTTSFAEPESAGEFVAVLADAMATTDVDTLTARLHPAVVARYGVDQCRAYVATQGDPSFGLVLVATTDPEVWSYATDGLAADVDDTFTATVDQTRAGETTRRDIHLAHVEGEIRWFSDCGTPAS